MKNNIYSQFSPELQAEVDQVDRSNKEDYRELSNPAQTLGRVLFTVIDSFAQVYGPETYAAVKDSTNWIKTVLERSKVVQDKFDQEQDAKKGEEALAA